MLRHIYFKKQLPVLFLDGIKKTKTLPLLQGSLRNRKDPLQTGFKTFAKLGRPFGCAGCINTHTCQVRMTDIKSDVERVSRSIQVPTTL